MEYAYRAEKPLGYVQLAVDTATTLGAIPVGAVFAIIVPENQAIRFRDDGVAPTATVGMPLPVLARLKYTVGNLQALRVIGQVAGAIVNVAYYGLSLIHI